MSEQKATTSSSLHLDPAAAARLLSALDTPTPPPNQPANTGANPVAPPAYIIDRALGSGGGGTVHRAFREGSDRPVALKVLDYSLSLDSEGKPRHSQAAQRAWRELQLLEDLHLPVLPRLLDHGVMPSGRVFFATEFIEGKTLEEFASTPPPPGRGSGASRGGGTPDAPETRGFADSSPASGEGSLASLALLLAKVCDAVQVLHEHGILHRDLKPSNILIDLHGQPVLIDLGIAAIFEYPGGTDLQSVSSCGGAGFSEIRRGDRPAFPTITETGAPIGTPAYMAPEQARGERQRISTRSDVYSLGATAYRLLTGTTPHDTNTTIHEAIRRVAFDEARDPRSISPGLPKPLAAVLLKACAREPEKRYATAAALGADLRRWANGEAVEAVPPGAWERTTRWAGRHPMITMVSFAFLVASLALSTTSFGIWWLNFRPASVEAAAENSQVNLRSANGRVLENWDFLKPKVVQAALFVRPIPGLIADPMVLMAISDESPHKWSGRLVGVNARTLEVAWMTGHDGNSRPEPLRLDGFGGMVVGQVIRADVFPERPGDEFIALFVEHLSAPTAVRVYDALGSMLFEVWHGGHLVAEWLDESGLIILTGWNNGFEWKTQGVEMRRARYPIVVAAVRPRFGDSGRLLSPILGANHLQPEWYRWLSPPRSADVFVGVEPHILARPGSLGPFVEIRLLATGGSGALVGLDIDSAGHVVDRRPNNAWVVGPLLDADSLTLQDWPPVVP